jgi:beta-ribofuranosylaminobenzene 5'-phosphate synthase
MTPVPENEAVFVEAPARLHFGVLDLRGGLGRWFGGIGAAAPSPTLLVSACRSDTLEVAGEDADRAAGFARQMLAHHGLGGGARLCVHRSLPSHAGLGSGTQLALAVACALGELYGLGTEPAELSRAVGRADRSAIGTYAFARGGLIVEGGRCPGSEKIAPLLARLPFPSTWRCIVGVPHTAPGMSGADETAAFDKLEAPAEREVERVSHLVLMALLPALADADLAAFGKALSAIQSITGRWFAPVQGGTFAPGPSADLVRSMAQWGALGVGQSSWGPAVYGIVDGEARGHRLAQQVGAELGPAGSVFEGAFPADGARVWRAPIEQTAHP